jgi:hypothetical protein
MAYQSVQDKDIFLYYADKKFAIGPTCFRIVLNTFLKNGTTQLKCMVIFHCTVNGRNNLLK